MLRVLCALSALCAASCGHTSQDAAARRSPNADSTRAGSAFYAGDFARTPSAAALTQLGRALFFNTALSASGRMACSTCHDPAHAWGPPNSRAVQLGGADLKVPGARAVPSLRYAQDTPPFSEHFADDDDDDGADQGPAGGFDWDGRAQSAHEQARAPLLSPFEMANGDSASVVARLRSSAAAPLFRSTFGDRVLDDTPLAWKGILMALETFQQSPADFYPYSSRYDDFLRGKGNLSPKEQRGLALFNDPARGNCAQCHPSELQRGAFPQFTDRGFVSLGVPRNAAIPANADPNYFDLGLCGPLRADLATEKAYCGMFKTPTLRNVAARNVFFHNGVFGTLADVVRFYQQRDVHPERFYSRSKGADAVKFDDLPATDRANVSFDPPFDAAPRAKPRFSDADAADIVAFLQTLTDSDVCSAPHVAAPSATAHIPARDTHRDMSPTTTHRC